MKIYSTVSVVHSYDSIIFAGEVKKKILENAQLKLLSEVQYSYANDSNHALILGYTEE